MKARIAVVALVALGLSASTALGVCGPPAARTLALTADARIYAPPAPRAAPVRIAARHLASGGAAVPLATELTRRTRVGRRTIARTVSVQVPRIAGGFAGLAVRDFDSLGRGRTTIRVTDLLTRAVAFTTRSTRGNLGTARQWNVTDLALSSDGRAAWITVYRPDPSQSQVWIRTFKSGQQIDSGAIDPFSLEITESEFGPSITYTKDGGTTPGDSSLDG